MQETQEMWVGSLDREDPWIGKIPWTEMATHSSILAGKISRTEELIGLGSQS